MTITTEMLERAGCIIEGIFAYDVTDTKCVAQRRGDGTWFLWRPETWNKIRRRFRVKAKGVIESLQQ